MVTKEEKHNMYKNVSDHMSDSYKKFIDVIDEKLFDQPGFSEELTKVSICSLFEMTKKMGIFLGADNEALLSLAKDVYEDIDKKAGVNQRP